MTSGRMHGRGRARGQRIRTVHAAYSVTYSPPTVILFGQKTHLYYIVCI